ncbi:MAG: STAS domain-containing protein [Sedimentisphaerales bacterium]|jgi:anti-sigma B factor antagonist|nr:STAS domain-containing protein [Sedimentisphaerales bacterium]NLZ05978.1 STAS domain-containing protein [Phycisphaerae bacterium]HNY80276.1 STAS domain-containing protein [Sedimentisphaerales bacterium]HOH66036.1 STAS domain-containing protein [Sedimentisphaerales bacterium]HQA92056.1 STAS domain-containing protein [Sedimentisphaerales bacterium]
MESGETITVDNGQDVVVVTFEERAILEDQQIRKLDRALMPIIRTNPDKRLVLNFAKVKFVSSALLGLLIKVHKRVMEAGGHLQMSNLDGKVRRVFEITQLVSVFDIIASES